MYRRIKRTAEAYATALEEVRVLDVERMLAFVEETPAEEKR